MPEFMLEISPFSITENGDSQYFSLNNISSSFTVRTVIKAENRIMEIYDGIFAEA